METETGNEMVVLKDSEATIVSVPRGRFTLRFKDENARKRVLLSPGSVTHLPTSRE